MVEMQSIDLQKYTRNERVEMTIYFSPFSLLSLPDWILVRGTNLSTVPLMQYLLSVGVSNPSPLNTCPKCPPQEEHNTSVRA